MGKVSRLKGHNYYIDEAWLEHPYIQGNFRDIPMQGVCMVMNFHFDPNDSIDLHKYIEQDGHGVYKIWIYLSEEEYRRDTLGFHYREPLDSAKKNSIFLLFKKGCN